MKKREENVQYFLDLIKRSRRGRFKIYIGMIAGVGKSYRMLQEAHEMLDNGVDVQIGYIETHGRPERKLYWKDCLSYLVKKSSTKGKNWRRWTWSQLSNYIRSW